MSRAPSIRIKSRWFKPERPRGVREMAGASAFIVWRIAFSVLNSMRKADFQIDPGPKYFDFLAEWLVFLIQVADRLVYERLAPEQRFEFVSVLANRLADILIDNRADLLGTSAASDARGKGEFIDLLNLRSLDYADFRCEEGRIDYGFRRYLADQLSYAVGEYDTVWVHDQVMEIEAPRAVELLLKGLRDLLGDEPAPSARRVSVSGE
jgi:hypothetical protein